MERTSILVSINGAAVIYPAETGERRVWSDVSLDVHAGEWIVVTGPNGSGKSTLVSVLLGICPLSQGELTFAADTVIRGVLQQPDAQFVGDTIAEEFAYISSLRELPLPEFRRACRQALDTVGLVVEPERPVERLSGGQKQLVHIAAALASKPRVLVLDEPTAMLDPQGRHDVLEAVRRVHRNGTTIVWVTHRMEEAAVADRVIAFAGGGIAFNGSPREFFADTSEVGLTTASASPCIQLGMEPPFVVQTTALLLRRGYRLEPLPLTEDELAEAVRTLCR